MNDMADQPTSVHREWLRELLAELGFRPKEIPGDADGDLTFGYEGKTFWVSLDRTDPDYLRLIYPGFLVLAPGEEKVALGLCHSMARDTKLLKLWYAEATAERPARVSAAIDILGVARCFDGEQLTRMLRLLQRAGNRFIEAMPGPASGSSPS